MNLLEQFGEIRERAERGLPSALRFEAEGRELTRNFLPNERLILLGGGNIAQPLCRYAADLGFEVTVADDRRPSRTGRAFPRRTRSIATCSRQPSKKSASGRAITSRSSRAATATMRTVCAKFSAGRCRNTSA